jgi:hypothetical protein
LLGLPGTFMILRAYLPLVDIICIPRFIFLMCRRHFVLRSGVVKLGSLRLEKKSRASKNFSRIWYGLPYQVDDSNAITWAIQQCPLRSFFFKNITFPPSTCM